MVERTTKLLKKICSSICKSKDHRSSSGLNFRLFNMSASHSPILMLANFYASAHSLAVLNTWISSLVGGEMVLLAMLTLLCRPVAIAHWSLKKENKSKLDELIPVIFQSITEFQFKEVLISTTA